MLDQSAFENARRDHQAIAGKREALAVLPRAWAELVAEGHELLVETLVDKAEALSGYAPSGADALGFLTTLQCAAAAGIVAPTMARPPKPAAQGGSTRDAKNNAAAQSDRSVTYRLFDVEHQAANASIALTEILRAMAKQDPARIMQLSEAVRSRKRNHIARSPLEISPHRPDLARAAEFAPGWLVGLNIANREKMMILRAACRTYGLSMPGDLEVELPNA